MIAASDYSELWMSPYTAIRRMATISETYGTELARTDGRLKKEREAWATGVLGLALSKMKDEEYWVEIETVERTPDTRLHYINQSSGHNVTQTRCVENVDWEENVDDIMEVIGKKCSRAYPRNYLLVVHARHVGKVLNLDQVKEEMKKLSSPFLETWIVARIGEDHLIAAGVEPAGPEIVLNRTDLKNAEKQTPFTKKGKRGTRCGFQHLGPAFLPIP